VLIKGLSEPGLTCVSEQICCGLCIYRRQYGLRVCCGNDDDDNDDVSSSRRGRRKMHVVLAAQFNRAFDESVDAVEKSPTVVIDQSPLSAKAKENGDVVPAERSTADQASAAPSTSEQADHEVDATGTDGNVLEDGFHFPADAMDAEDVSRAQASVAEGDVDKATTNDSRDGIDDAISDRTSTDANPSLDETVDSANTEAGSETETRDTSAVTDGVLTDSTPEPEWVFTPVALPETENNCRRKSAPSDRRWRSMGAGSRQRRVVNTSSCDKAVNVHEDDLLVQPSEENKTEETTQTGDPTVKGDPRMFGNLVLDLDELGLPTAHDDKQEEVRDSCRVEQFLPRDACMSAAYVVVRRLSVFLRLSRSCIVSKRLKIRP